MCYLGKRAAGAAGAVGADPGQVRCLQIQKKQARSGGRANKKGALGEGNMMRPGERKI